MNHFFALKLPEEARQIIHRAASEWREGIMPASWYDPGDYHITLKFLGDLDEAEQPHLVEAAEPIAKETATLIIRAASFGGFPNRQVPSVLWAGIEITPELDTLASQLNEAMGGLGFRADRRRYQPHVTVARCRPQASRGLDWPLPSERLFAEFTVSCFALMRTRSSEERANRSGLRYNLVHTFPFGRLLER